MNDPIVEYITEKHPDRDTLMLKSPHKVSEKGIGIKLSTEHTEKPYFSYYKSPWVYTIIYKMALAILR